MQKLTLLFVAVLLASTSFAKIWRVNNNAGVVADFTDLPAAVSSASVIAGDTIHVEASGTDYSGFTPTKRLVYIGPGYFLNPSDVSFPYNAGLQAATQNAKVGGIQMTNSAAAGSKFLGLWFNSYIIIYGSATSWNLTFEKDVINYVTFYDNGSNVNSNGITIRKCLVQIYITANGSVPTMSNVTIENCIFYQAYFNLGGLIGTGNVIRNNSQYANNSTNAISNAYVSNNVFGNGAQGTFTNCTLKNNLFQVAQTLPGTATGNQVSVNMTNVYVGGTTGSLDSRVALKAGSPAIGAGVTIAGYTPDCGAFGGPDPYKLSGIPPIPSIYSLTIPTSIPTGTATMNVTFSSRNNN